jgi:putative transposase
VQYLAIRYTDRLADIGAITSVGSRGDSYDTQSSVRGEDAAQGLARPTTGPASRSDAMTSLALVRSAV